ncbi:MAG TPA: cupin domain-containing protein [Chthonomonadaceae bacterium]|nr:cupin domain-containing protein [Chthonomonadaceae bacterium]
MRNADAQWTLDFEIKGEERTQALAEAARILKDWGLTMPPVDPLTIDFGLRNFRRIGEIEYWIVNDRDRNYCGKFLLLFENQRCPRHQHRMKDETFFIVKGTVAMEADDREFLMQEGDTYQMAPGVVHTFAAVGGPALVLEVSLPSIPGDNIFEDRRIGRDGVL